MLNRFLTKPLFALRQTLKEGYSFHDFRADFLAACVVALVAIPLGMALGIASGVPPENGLYTVIIAGIFAALLGGSKLQVSGPTAAFVVLLAPITHQFGISGLLIAGLIAGVILVLLGVTGVGRLIQYIPYPVTTGFTAGIAVVIATLQIKDFLGLSISEMPERYIEKTIAIITHLPTLQISEFFVGAFTLALLILWPRFHKRIPGPLVALTSATVLTSLCKRYYPDSFFSTIQTIESKFQYHLSSGDSGWGIPPLAPHFQLPTGIEWSTNTVQALLLAGVSIAVLGAIESLLSAVIADGMAKTKSDPDAELLGLGVANIIGPFFGAIASTGAIARTATNIRFGAKSPIASILHGLITLLVVLFFAKWVSLVPLASLAALLLMVAYNMADLKHLTHTIKVAPKEDLFVLFLCFGLTVFFDMTIGVATGVMAAAFLFIKNATRLSYGEVLSKNTNKVELQAALSDPTVQIYRINGPLFFGAAEKATRALESIGEEVKDIIFLMDSVPFIDVTGVIALESSVLRLKKRKVTIYLVGEQKPLAEVLNKSEIISRDGNQVKHFAELPEALAAIHARKENRK